MRALLAGPPTHPAALELAPSGASTASPEQSMPWLACRAANPSVALEHRTRLGADQPEPRPGSVSEVFYLWFCICAVSGPWRARFLPCDARRRGQRCPAAVPVPRLHPLHHVPSAQFISLTSAPLSPLQKHPPPPPLPPVASSHLRPSGLGLMATVLCLLHLPGPADEARMRQRGPSLVLPIDAAILETALPASVSDQAPAEAGRCCTARQAGGGSRNGGKGGGSGNCGGAGGSGNCGVDGGSGDGDRGGGGQVDGDNGSYTDAVVGVTSKGGAVETGTAAPDTLPAARVPWTSAAHDGGGARGGAGRRTMRSVLCSAPMPQLLLLRAGLGTVAFG